MKSAEAMDPRRAGAAQAEWSGIGWTDSSWELAHGLDVVEDLPAEAWPVELVPSASAGLRSPVADALKR